MWKTEKKQQLHKKKCSAQGEVPLWLSVSGFIEDWRMEMI